jgi:hypothetical protein
MFDRSKMIQLSIFINNIEKVFFSIPIEDGQYRSAIVYPDEYKLFWQIYDDSVVAPADQETWWIIIQRKIYIYTFENSEQCLIRLECRDWKFKVKNPRTWLMPIESLYVPDVLGYVIKAMTGDQNFIPMFSGSTSAGISTIINGPFVPTQSVSSRYSNKIVN